MKKTELVLAKKSMIECLVGELVARPAMLSHSQPPPQQAQAGTEHKAGMWQDMMQAWEGLTSMRVEDGVAIIPFRGMVTPDDPFAPFFGETNLAMFNKNFDKALNDPKIKGIVGLFYSPGGYVYGVEATASRVFEARGTKPLIAYTDTLSASASYWVMSAFDKIVLGSETAEVGSLGVYLVHFDYSEMLTKEGIKVTEITSGEFKGIGSPFSAMTEAEKKMLQADSNYVYTRFVETVAQYRGMKVDAVLKVANGLTFYGSDAVKVGLADSINTFQEVIAMTTEVTKPAASTGPTAEQVAAAEVEARTAAQAKLKAEADAAELQKYRDKEAKAATEKLAGELNVAVKAAHGRVATEAEVKLYAGLDEDGRKTYLAGLKETADNRDKLVKKTGLLGEQATGGTDAEHSPENNLIVLAARSLGLAETPKSNIQQ